MKFNKHFDLEGKHAFLSASNYHWINYDDEKLDEVFFNMRAKERGTELHEFAAKAIKLRVRLQKSRQTLNMYVNDAISYKMEPEVVLQYSDNCWGTVDSISFNEKNSFLRIHDLKTGKSQTSMHQLEIYAALFCLEYRKDPRKISVELRIYQRDEIVVSTPTPEEIQNIMDLIVRFDKRIDDLKKG